MAQQIYFEDVSVGDELPAVTNPPVTQNQFVRYSGASGDFNPLHTDPEFARQAGLDAVIAHGMLIMGFVGRMVSDYVGPGALRRFGVRFKGMTRPGDVIICSGRVKEKLEVDGEARIRCDVQAADAAGDVKVAGSFEAALPRRG
jgi:acyl dehydratase